MIADGVINNTSSLCRHEFFVGNIALDYIDYLPKGAIVRKVKVMGCMLQKEISQYPYIGMSVEEYNYFICRATKMVVEAIEMYQYTKRVTCIK